MRYEFSRIEKKWQALWAEKEVFATPEESGRPKCYVLDMFPYPSGEGLHVGHPLGYIASDIYSRYKRACGYNVLHPMGFDAFGLPAEQFAIQTGCPPEASTEKNIIRYREQLQALGLSYDWDRELRTCDPGYYHWTQWAFLRMFHSWYDREKNKARPLRELLDIFAREGNGKVRAAGDAVEPFSAEEWANFSPEERDRVLGCYRMAYLADTPVNWCPALGTVLANDEVADGLSVRGGHPVKQKILRQWSLRISAYAGRLLAGLDELDWSESIKEIQRHWIGRSEGVSLNFKLEGRDDVLQVFTTRPDTLFGVSFMALAPEHPLVLPLTAPERREEVAAYLSRTSEKGRREREAGTGEVSGVWTGGYALHPFSGEKIPVWVGDYVLGDYGSGAIMAVPAHDGRDYAFAKHFGLPIPRVIDGGELPHESKEGVCVASDFLNGLAVNEAIARMKEEVEKRGIGRRKINYRLRDAIFSRQRYWGEPFPICYKDGLPQSLPEDSLPLNLPYVDDYKPTPEGNPPLAKASDWKSADGLPLETCTMPGFAGSCAYWLRYMDPHNSKELCDREKSDYWGSVDLYLGGAEHATGHLIYARFWTKFLRDLGYITVDEPFKRLFNQGMIQGRSSFVYRIKGEGQRFVSHGLKDKYDVQTIHVDVNLVRDDVLDLEGFRRWRPEFASAQFELEDGRYLCGHAVEKMSKSLYNVVNPDDVIAKYGADTLRLYEMFLGPLDQAKPWNTNGIEGTARFLNKFWGLFFVDDVWQVTDEEADARERKILHSCLKKVTENMERMAFNTSISAFMIATGELGKKGCRKRQVLEPLVIALAPFAPHLCEELYQLLGHAESVSRAPWPAVDETFLQEDSFKCPVSFNGKTRFVLELPREWDADRVREHVLGHEKAAKYLAGKTVKKVIFVPGKILNVVLS